MAKGTANIFDIDVTKYMAGLNVPTINPQALVTNQRKNLEALADANKLALEGMQAVARRQTEMVNQGVEELSEAFNELMGAETFEDRAGKQADLAKTAYQTVLANFWDLGEMITKSNSRAFGVINKRVAESLDEVKELVTPKAPSVH
jgi:phasin family protein